MPDKGNLKQPRQIDGDKPEKRMVIRKGANI